MYPLPEERADLRAAMITAKIHNASGNYKTSLTVADAMPKFGEAPKGDDALFGQFKAYATMQPGTE